MLLLDALVEQRIACARDAGEFDNLPGAGKPLELDDDRLVPEELRVAHRILKNAGCLPPEVSALREITDEATLLKQAVDAATRTRAATRLALLRAMLEGEGRSLSGAGHDHGRILQALQRDFRLDDASATEAREARRGAVPA